MMMMMMNPVVVWRLQGVKVRYEIPSTDPNGEHRRLAKMFGTIQEAKTQLYIEDYSVSQTSLEQASPT
jgi:hypothetical protein